MSRNKARRIQPKISSSNNISFSPKTENQKKLVESIETNQISFAIGFPGVGKSYVASACALKMLLANQIDKIIIVKPTVGAGQVEIGFLPGDINDKISPYAEALLDLFDRLVPDYVLETLYEEGKIEVRAVSFLRGCNWERTFIIVDEAQNLEKSLFYMLLSRLVGSESKIVLCGDEFQNDLRYNQKSGLGDAVNRYGKIDGVGIVEFNIEDCQRSEIVKEIIKAYFNNEIDKKELPKNQLISDPRLTEISPLPKKRVSRKKTME